MLTQEEMLELKAVFRRAAEEAYELYNEVWLTADELCKQFQMFSKDWVEKYGDILPRKRVKVTHLNGETRGTRWAYTQHEIAMNIRNGVYDDMKLLR